jgi:hypothetical protein
MEIRLTCRYGNDINKKIHFVNDGKNVRREL